MNLTNIIAAVIRSGMYEQLPDVIAAHVVSKLTDAGYSIVPTSEANEPKRIRDGIHQLVEESCFGLYGDYGPVVIEGSAVAELLDAAAAEGTPMTENRMRSNHDVYRVTPEGGYSDTPCFCPASQNHPVGREGGVDRG
ncbi:hypothetical protein [Rhodococcus sp. IEGM 1330]|uniref:hypothetical protein n=1 Tax=Rhodococcus sp. IEGM 1330 TaxID=3082225 RepID=UPI0029545B03|nr:hypothetical protein [Rhodococcus sp. IEGM 1330]MDV8022294.1 hypothetical protein [Rhodococcus sp. IEGM 1330]